MKQIKNTRKPFLCYTHEFILFYYLSEMCLIFQNWSLNEDKMGVKLVHYGLLLSWSVKIL